MKLDHHIGEKLRIARTAVHLSHSDAAHQLQLTELELKQLENGAKRIDARTLHRAAQAFDVEIRWFFENMQGATSQAVGTRSEKKPRDTVRTSIIENVRLNTTLSKLCEVVRESDYQGISRKFVA